MRHCCMRWRHLAYGSRGTDCERRSPSSTVEFVNFFVMSDSVDGLSESVSPNDECEKANRIDPIFVNFIGGLAQTSSRRTASSSLLPVCHCALAVI